MKISIIFLTLILIISNSFTNVFWAEETSSLSKNTSYVLYKERVKDICWEYKTKKTLTDDLKVYPEILSNEKYEELTWWIKKQIEAIQDKIEEKEDELIKKRNEWSIDNIVWLQNEIDWLNNEMSDLFAEIEKYTNKFDLAKTKYTYKSNMDNIYECWMWNSMQIISNLIFDELLKKDYKWIAPNVSNLDYYSCNTLREKNPIIKLNVLKQSTYETCSYVSYLEYLREYYKDNVISSIVDNSKDYKVWEILNERLKTIDEIDTEIEKVYKVFPLAFNAYTEFENNYTIHQLLVIIKYDYLRLRENLHKTLNPINQVVYKIANAMSK